MDDREYGEVRERAEERLLAIPGVHAVGVGDKLTGGERTDELSIRVYMTHRQPLSEVPPEERVPPKIEGVKTDVVEMPMPTIDQTPGIPQGTKREDTAEYRPVRGGTQLKLSGGAGAGTLGCLLTVTGDSRVIALTNHHVVTGACTDAASGEVGQPDGTSSSSASCDDIIATVLDTQCDDDGDVALVRLKRRARRTPHEDVQAGLPTGDSRRGTEVAAEVLAHRRRLFPPPAPGPPVAPVGYEAMNSVPDYWIPFLSVHVPGSNRSVQLQRATMPSEIDQQPVPPRTAILREGLDSTPKAERNPGECQKTSPWCPTTSTRNRR